MSIHKRDTTRGTRYDVKLRAPDGRMYQRSFRTKREAEAYQANELSDRARGKWLDPRGGLTPFAEWAAEWLVSNPGKRPGSVARDEAVIRVHLKPPFGSRPLATIADPSNLLSLPHPPNSPRWNASTASTASAASVVASSSGWSTSIWPT